MEYPLVYWFSVTGKSRRVSCLDISATPRFIEGTLGQVNRLTVLTVSLATTNGGHVSKRFRVVPC